MGLSDTVAVREIKRVIEKLSRGRCIHKKQFYCSSSLLCFRCLIYFWECSLFEQPASLTLGGLAWPEEGVKVKMGRAYSSQRPHGVLRGLAPSSYGPSQAFHKKRLCSQLSSWELSIEGENAIIAPAKTQQQSDVVPTCVSRFLFSRSASRGVRLGHFRQD